MLLIDSDDGDFVNASQVSYASYANNVVTFDNVDFAAGDWFTIASLSAVNPLPIELLTFEANANEDKVDLKWVTSTEINNDYFTIERSDNGIDWEEVLTANGAGNSNQAIEYFETDYEPLKGISYYRLKQTDFDGQYSYSNIVPVKFVENNKSNINLYPNPVNAGETINIEFSNISEKELLVVLRDMQGREFASKLAVNVEEGKLIGISLDSSIPKGVYLVVASSENQMYSQRLIIR